MNNRKISFFVVLSIWVLTVVYLIYHSIDLGYTIAYQNDSYTSTNKDLKKLAKIISARKFNQAEIKRILDQDSLDYIETDSLISLENLELVFRNDSSFLRIDWN